MLSLAFNKSNVCSVRRITSNCSTLGGLIYVRGIVMTVVGGRAGLTVETLMSQLLWAWSVTLNRLTQ